jgi:hypothetical protein
MLSSASTIGARQCAALHKQFAALHFFLTLPIIWAQVAAKRFCKIQDGPCPFKINKKNVQRFNTRAIPVD